MPDAWGIATIAAKFLLYLGVLTSAGSVFTALVFRVPNMGPFATKFAFLGLVGALLGFSLNGAALTGDVSGMIDTEMLGLLWTTPVGTALVFRLVGLALLIFGLLLGQTGVWISTIGAGLALWSFATVGHIPDRNMLWLDLFLLIHLVAIALWIGILTPLRRLAIGGTTSDAGDLGHRFGRLAAFFVPLLILVGSVMSFILIGSITALVTTSYGQALILKVILVAGLLGLAALNKLRLVPGLVSGDAQAALRLSRSIAFEWAVIVVILLTTAVLTSVLTLPF